jgi:hypothetical protein
MLDRNRDENGGLQVTMADGVFDLVEDDFVVIDAAAPSFDGHLYMFYTQEDGKLIHLMPTAKQPDSERDAGSRFTIGGPDDSQRFSVTSPFGDDMITLIASDVPLFDQPRPQIESSAQFAADLARAVAIAEAAGARILADVVFVKTGPRLSS